MSHWADHAKAELLAGRSVQLRPHGNSMTPKIRSGDLVTISPVNPLTVEKGNIVLAHVAGNDYLHMVVVVRPGPRFQIGNNHGRVNGWCGPEHIFGILTKVEP